MKNDNRKVAEKEYLKPADRIRHRILATLMPAHSLKWLFVFYAFFVLVILGLAHSFHNSLIPKDVFLSLLVTFTLFMCIYTGLSGIFFFSNSHPYLNEWKDKLGYNEKY